MGVTFYSHISPYTFLMSILWFNAFVLLSLLMRKLRYPIKFSVLPLTVLFALSLLRMFLAIDISGTVHIFSARLLPTVVYFLRHEVIPYETIGLSVNVLHTLLLIWGTGSVFFLTRYAIHYWKAYWTALSLSYASDEEAEAILAEINDSKKRGRVFRTPIKVPFTIGIKPYIYLPEGVDFTPDELRTILRHEWKHIQSKDYLVEFVMRFISYVFWWNPLVYVLRKNVSFARELRCDYFAVGTSEVDYEHYKNGLRRICGEKPKDLVPVSGLINAEAEFADRFKTLALCERDKTRNRRTLASIGFYLLVGTLFLSSYTFLVLPAHWESNLEHVDDGIERPIECAYIEEAFRAKENYLIDNGDGTFSLYIDGQHVLDTEDTSLEMFSFLPIRTHEE